MNFFLFERRVFKEDIWKSFFGVYLKFAWLKTSKSSTPRIFSRKTWTKKASFSHFSLECFDVMSDDFKWIFGSTNNKKWLFLRMSIMQILDVMCDTAKKLFHMGEFCSPVRTPDWWQNLESKNWNPKNCDIIFCVQGIISNACIYFLTQSIALFEFLKMCFVHFATMHFIK